MVGVAMTLALAAGWATSVQAQAAGGCEPDARGEVTIAVVVDFGFLRPDAEPSRVCVSVPPGADGSEVLAARSERLGTPPPRYDSSGLLCAIDGLPERGCAEASEAGYRYWSYWLGSDGGWEYSSRGPAFRRAVSDVAEGWHFIDGTDSGTDPPPRGPADPDAIPIGAIPPGDADLTATAGEGSAGDGEFPAGAVGGLILVVAVIGVAVLTLRRRRS